MNATPKPYPLAGELNGTIRDGGRYTLRPGQTPPKPYPVWSWQKRRRWIAEMRELFGEPWQPGEE